MGCCLSQSSDPYVEQTADEQQAENGSVADNRVVANKRRVKKYKALIDERIIDKYEIQAMIGKGSFSRVFRVEQKNTKEPFAVKMIDKKSSADQWSGELTVLRRVRHKYVIRLTEAIETNNRIYLVMELATGGELLEKITFNGPFRENETIRILLMVLKGLKYLHSLKIAHRDLKPENILFYHPGLDSKIIITDFGLSKVLKTDEMGRNFLQTRCGTPEYVAPEILAKKPYDTQVDLWALGVVCYVMLSASLPFDDENRMRLYRSIIRCEFTFPRHKWAAISQGARDFISQLLVSDPAIRLDVRLALNHYWLNKEDMILQNCQEPNASLIRRGMTGAVVHPQNHNRPESAHSLGRQKHISSREVDQLHKSNKFRKDVSRMERFIRERRVKSAENRSRPTTSMSMATKHV